MLPLQAPAAVLESFSSSAPTTVSTAITSGAAGKSGLFSLYILPHLKAIAIGVGVLILTGLAIHGVAQSGSGTSDVTAVPDKPARLTSITKSPPSEQASPMLQEVRQFTPAEQQAWLQAFRDHLNQPGPPHSHEIFETIGGLGGRERGGGYGGFGRSPLHQFIDRAGGDASGVIEVLKEGLQSERATVAYRTLGQWGWVREYAQEDGANTLIDFAAQTETRNLAMDALNILGQSDSHFPEDLTDRIAGLLESGSDNVKIALSYYGPGFMANEWLGEEFENRLLAMLEHPDAKT